MIRSLLVAVLFPVVVPVGAPAAVAGAREGATVVARHGRVTTARAA